jgi:hypothetical protein
MENGYKVNDRVQRMCATKPGRRLHPHGILKTGTVTHVGHTQVQVTWDDGMTSIYRTDELTPIKENA